MPDAYEMEAHGIPSALLISPLIIAVVGGIHEIWGLHWGVVACLLAGFGGIAKYMRMPGIRDRGKKAEEIRWREQGGCPTLRGLRHRNSEVPKRQQERAHKWGKEKGLDIPTVDEEAADPKNADEKWSLLWDALRDRGTQDARVRGKNRAYGRMRNAHASKSRGVASCVTAIAGTAIICYWKGTAECGIGTYGAIAAEIGMLGVWLGVITERNLGKADRAFTEAVFRMDLTRDAK